MLLLFHLMPKPKTAARHGTSLFTGTGIGTNELKRPALYDTLGRVQAK